MRYSIIAPHPDDEFIGCRTFIQTNLEDINNIIFLTNGEICPNEFVEPDYPLIRREESEHWLCNIANLDLAQVTYLNIPDAWDTVQIATGFGADIYLKTNANTRTNYIYEKIKEIVKDDTILWPAPENHPTHMFGAMFSTFFKNPCVLYYSHKILQEDCNTTEPGVYKEELNAKLNTYTYVYKKEDFEVKLAEWEKYYPSQKADLEKSKMFLRPYESYISEVELKLDF